MQRTVFTNGICSNCGYYENTKTDPLFLKPGTQLHSRYLVGTAISMNGEGITYLAYDYPNSCRVLLREYMQPCCGLCGYSGAAELSATV